MAFLKNDNNKITIQAVLTDAGKEHMARGTFNATKFKCFDDGVDYELYNILHPQGSDYYGSAISNLPIIEPTVGSPVPLKYPKYWIDGNEYPTNGWVFSNDGWSKDSIIDIDNEMILTYKYSTTISNLSYDLTKMVVRATLVPRRGDDPSGMVAVLTPTISGAVEFPTNTQLPYKDVIVSGIGHSFKLHISKPARTTVYIQLISELFILGTDNTWNCVNILASKFTKVKDGWGPAGPNYAGVSALGMMGTE